MPRTHGGPRCTTQAGRLHGALRDREGLASSHGELAGALKEAEAAARALREQVRRTRGLGWMCWVLAPGRLQGCLWLQAALLACSLFPPHDHLLHHHQHVRPGR